MRNTPEAYLYEIPFAEYPFWQPADTYDGNLAVMSLAFALSADRALNLDNEPEEDFDPALNADRFLKEAGFTGCARTTIPKRQACTPYRPPSAQGP